MAEIDAKDIERITKLTALGLQAFIEVTNIMKNKQAQNNKTEEEIAAHAEQANKEARVLIDAL